MSAVIKYINPSGARLDWAGIALALLGLVLLSQGVELSVVDVLVTFAGAALGRGALTTAQVHRQRAALNSVGPSVSAFKLPPEGE